MMPMITILGPTASGKTDIAAHLAARIDAEIISADSRQVYRRMDIGTGKDLDDYCVDGKNIPYHLIDIVEPGTKYNLFEYQRDFLEAYNGVRERGKEVILCGGTGLYIESVLKGYRLIPVEENKELRKSLEGKNLLELTEILERLKSENCSNMHNITDVDTTKRAIRAIEIETAYRKAPVEERTFPKIDTLIIGWESTGRCADGRYRNDSDNDSTTEWWKKWKDCSKKVYRRKTSYTTDSNTNS